MALEGSLKEFGLADILQLLYFQRKTGVLILEGRMDRIRLLFSEGKVVNAESRRRSEENRLGKILIRKGLIGEPELKAAVQEQRATASRLGHILIKQGLVDKEQLIEILTSQITETVIQLFAWKEGRYEFNPQGIPVDKEVPILLDTQHLLMEGSGMVDEWTQLEGKIQLDSLFKKTNKPSDNLSPEELEILEMVDGENDVSTIVDLSGMDSYSVSKTLLNLYESGFTVTKTADDDVSLAPELTPASAIIRQVPLLAIIVALAISIAVAFNTTDLDLRTFNANRDIDTIRFKVNAYTYKTGMFPATLDEIGIKTDPWGEPYQYMVTEEGYVHVKSAGPDKQIGTADDVY